MAFLEIIAETFLGGGTYPHPCKAPGPYSTKLNREVGSSVRDESNSNIERIILTIDNRYSSPSINIYFSFVYVQFTLSTVP